MTSRGADQRPRATFALFAYNQEQYVREAVDGALDQDHDSLEVILSDDCSTDGTFEIMQNACREYSGPHTVVLNRNPVNLGVAGHVNKVLAMSRGDIILFAAGDDVSHRWRTGQTVQLFSRYRDASAVSFGQTVIDPHGRPVRRASRLLAMARGERTVTLVDLFRSRVHMSGASRAIRRDVFTTFGPLDARCPTEDTPFMLRSLLVGRGVISRRPAILYRKHQDNLSSAAGLRKMDFDLIEQQYRNDVQTAVERNLSSELHTRHFEEWLESRRQWWNLRKLLADPAATLDAQAVRRAIGNRSLGPMEKLEFVRRWIAAPGLQ